MFDSTPLSKPKKDLSKAIKSTEARKTHDGGTTRRVSRRRVKARPKARSGGSSEEDMRGEKPRPAVRCSSSGYTEAEDGEDVSIQDRASNEGYPKVPEDFTIMEKAPDRGQRPFSIVS